MRAMGHDTSHSSSGPSIFTLPISTNLDTELTHDLVGNRRSLRTSSEKQGQRWQGSSQELHYSLMMVAFGSTSD